MKRLGKSARGGAKKGLGDFVATSMVALINAVIGGAIAGYYTLKATTEAH